MKEYIIFGAGDYLNDIFDLIHANQGKVIKLFQNIPDIKREGRLTIQNRVSRLEYEIEIHDSLTPFQPEQEYHYVLGFIAVHKSRLIAELKEQYGITFSRLIHPGAHVSSNVHIGEGVIIGPLSSIGPNAFLDDFCSINRSASIGHDVRIGKYTRVGPSVALAGSTRIGDNCNVGINATVLDYVKVGNWAVIGAGSVVAKDLPESVVAYGVPAKIVRANEDQDFATYRAKRSF